MHSADSFHVYVPLDHCRKIITVYLSGNLCLTHTSVKVIGAKLLQVLLSCTVQY